MPGEDAPGLDRRGRAYAWAATVSATETVDLLISMFSRAPSPAPSTSTLTWSPSVTSLASERRARAFSTSRWISRRSGRAP